MHWTRASPRPEAAGNRPRAAPASFWTARARRRSRSGSGSAARPGVDLPPPPPLPGPGGPGRGRGTIRGWHRSTWSWAQAVDRGDEGACEVWATFPEEASQLEVVYLAMALSDVGHRVRSAAGRLMGLSACWQEARCASLHSSAVARAARTVRSGALRGRVVEREMAAARVAGAARAPRPTRFRPPPGSAPKDGLLPFSPRGCSTPCTPAPRKCPVSVGCTLSLVEAGGLQTTCRAPASGRGPSTKSWQRSRWCRSTARCVSGGRQHLGRPPGVSRTVDPDEVQEGQGAKGRLDASGLGVFGKEGGPDHAVCIGMDGVRSGNAVADRKDGRC